MAASSGHWIGIAMTNRVRAAGAGTVTALLLQSSSATGLLTSSFAARGMVGAGSALAIMLGADLGTSLVTQAYALPIYFLSPLLILVGYVMFQKLQSTQLRDLGRAGIGLGLVLLSLRLIGEAAEPIRANPVLPDILALMNGSPTIGVLVGGALTVLCASSVAVVLLIASFVSAGVLPVPLALAFILGANLCADVMAMLTSMGDPAEGRRVQIGNMIFRAIGVVVMLPFLSLIAPELPRLGGNAMQQILKFPHRLQPAAAGRLHRLRRPVARLTKRILPDAKATDDPARPRYLALGAIDSPTVALANASREGVCAWAMPWGEMAAPFVAGLPLRRPPGDQAGDRPRLPGRSAQRGDQAVSGQGQPRDHGRQRPEACDRPHQLQHQPRAYRRHRR